MATSSFIEGTLKLRLVTYRKQTQSDIMQYRYLSGGKSIGLKMFETLEILGNERMFRQIDRTLTERQSKKLRLR